MSLNFFIREFSYANIWGFILQRRFISEPLYVKRRVWSHHCGASDHQGIIFFASLVTHIQNKIPKSTPNRDVVDVFSRSLLIYWELTGFVTGPALKQCTVNDKQRVSLLWARISQFLLCLKPDPYPRVHSANLTLDIFIRCSYSLGPFGAVPSLALS